MSEVNEAVIISATRTPVGKFLGSLKNFSAPALGAIVVREAVKRAGVKPEDVDEVMMAAQGIKLGDTEMVVAGGMESMSNAPYLLPKAREGYRLGNGELVDSMINDGLWCAFENYHMGCTGEVVAEEYRVSRSEQDEFAMNSHRKAAAAIKEGRFKDEILGVEIPQKKGAPVVFDTDEPVREDSSL